MITSFLKKLTKYHMNKFIHWLRMKKFNFDLNREIKHFHDSYWREVAKEKPEFIKN
tara:strand:- start:292 stop:459 length:168 start_codon:yes stop_codon:yes gene_type:complete